MLTVTPAANDRLVRKLKGKGAEEGVAMRFVRRTGGWRLRLDKPAVGDVLFAHEGRTVLVLDAACAGLLADRTLDAVAAAAGPRLKLSR